MPLLATRHRTASRLRGVTPTAGRGKTAAGSRYRRMYRGNCDSSLPGLTRQSIRSEKNVLPKIDGCAGQPAHDEQNSSRIKHDDAAHGLAGLHGGKALVDLGQFQLRRDPVLEMQLAAHVELDEPRHVDAEMVGAHRRALDFSFAQEIKAMQLDLLAE